MFLVHRTLIYFGSKIVKHSYIMNRNLFFFLLLTSIVFACKKDNLHPVPSIPFNINININLPSYSGLQNIGGYAYVNNIGSKGVVVYRRSIDEFVAYDRQSTVDGGLDCGPVEIDEENSLLVNDVCGTSQYSLFDGSVVTGPAEFGLRGYLTIYDGAFTLNISN